MGKKEMRQKRRGKGVSSPERMEALIKEQKESGQSVKEYCREQGITPSVWYYWKKRNKGKEELPALGFARIEIEGGSCQEGVQVEIELPGVGIVRLSGQIRAGYIRQIMGLER